MAIKKSQIYSSLLESTNILRGGMDASQYKNYVLVLLFVKYISDKKDDPNSLITIPDGCTFADMVKLKEDNDIGEKMNKILARIGEANGLSKELAEADFADEQKLGKGKDLVRTVSKLIGAFQREDLDFSHNRAADDDLIGDAYEFLMRNFAAESGKSKGQFYTPAEVSRLMAKLVGIGKDERRRSLSIYDPTCGSGSLLLRTKNECKGECSIQGQEFDLATIGMARMSMIIHGVEDPDLRHGDTLNSPLHTKIVNGKEVLDSFDYVVANPPFSQKNWMKAIKEKDTFKRWGNDKEGEGNYAKCPPPMCGDYAFLLHIIESMKSDGHAVCIMPHGVLFRGNVEADIRKYIIKKRIISGIIGLPTNTFFGTSIGGCIIVLDKQHASTSSGIFMIDAKDGYIKDGAKNRLREEDIKRIADVWENKEEIPHYSRFVTYKELENENKEIRDEEGNVIRPEGLWSLSISRFVTPVDTEIRQDLNAHLHGGLPAYDVDEVLAHVWKSCPTLKDALFTKTSEQYYALKIDKDTIQKTITSDGSYKHQSEVYAKSIAAWADAVRQGMYDLAPGIEPKEAIELWGQHILDCTSKGSELVDHYNVYEILMNYWAETMQDDLYLISRDDWPVTIFPAKTKKVDKKKKEISYTEKKNPTYRDYECDLLPVQVVIDEYYPEEDANIKNLEAEVERISGEMNQLMDDNEADFNGLEKASDVKARYEAGIAKAPIDGEQEILLELLEMPVNNKPAKEARNTFIAEHHNIFEGWEKYGKTEINKRLKEIAIYSPILPDTIELYKSYIDLNDQLSCLKKQLKEAMEELKENMLLTYGRLQNDKAEVRRLVVEKKWLATITKRSEQNINRLSLQIANDVKSLVERYESTLTQLNDSAASYENKVIAHLAKMGITL